MAVTDEHKALIKQTAWEVAAAMEQRIAESRTKDLLIHEASCSRAAKVEIQIQGVRDALQTATTERYGDKRFLAGVIAVTGAVVSALAVGVPHVIRWLNGK